MSFLWPLPKKNNFKSILWRQSQSIPGARFAIRRISFSQRLELARRIRELSLKEEFLRAGAADEQLGGAICDLLARKALLEWGFVDICGFTIDGRSPSLEMMLDKGPEALVMEIVAAIQTEASLSEQERKNS